jgi:hypothetical protein
MQISIDSKGRMGVGRVIIADLVEQMRRREAVARHLQMFSPEAGEAVVHRRRPTSGLVVRAFRHDALSPLQIRALAGFRLRQYVLCGFYDPAVVAARDLEVDPEVKRLPGGTLHILAGDAEGRLLAYSYLCPAGGEGEALLETAERPLFPCEYESFGRQVFTSLPGLRRTPIGRIAELSLVLRNQAVPSALATTAVAEVVLATTRIQTSFSLDALVGCMNARARRFLACLGLPVLYAPLAPVVHDRLQCTWAATANAPGNYWPFVVATADLVRGQGHLHQLEQVLASRVPELRAGLAALRRRSGIAATALAPDPHASPTLWTADHTYQPEPVRSAAA